MSGGISRAISARELLSRLAGKATVKERRVREITRKFSVEDLHELLRAIVEHDYELGVDTPAEVSIDVNYVTDFDGFSDDSRDVFDGFTVTVTQELED